MEYLTPLQIINDYIQSQEHQPYPKDGWRASSAGYCPRRVFLERKQVLKTNPPDERTMRVFAAGDTFHAWAQNIVDEAYRGKDTRRELELASDELQVVGHVDQVIELDRGWTLIDYKSQNSRAFWHAKKSGENMMKPWQRLQFGTYMYMLIENFPYMEPTLATIACYISKDDMTIEQVILPWDEKLKADVEEYWSGLNALWELDQLPDCECANSNNAWMVKYCPYHKDGKCCNDSLFKQEVLSGI